MAKLELITRTELSRRRSRSSGPPYPTDIHVEKKFGKEMGGYTPDPPETRCITSVAITSNDAGRVHVRGTVVFSTKIINGGSQDKPQTPLSKFSQHHPWTFEAVLDPNVKQTIQRPQAAGEPPFALDLAVVDTPKRDR